MFHKSNFPYKALIFLENQVLFTGLVNTHNELYFLPSDISPEPISAEEQERLESNKQELDRYLGVYPYDRYG